MNATKCLIHHSEKTRNYLSAIKLRQNKYTDIPNKIYENTNFNAYECWSNSLPLKECNLQVASEKIFELKAMEVVYLQELTAYLNVETRLWTFYSDRSWWQKSQYNNGYSEGM